MPEALRLGKPKVITKQNAVVLAYSEPVPIAIRIPPGANVFSILRQGYGQESGVGILTEKGELHLLGMSNEEAEAVYRQIIASIKLVSST